MIYIYILTYNKQYNRRCVDYQPFGPILSTSYAYTSQTRPPIRYENPRKPAEQVRVFKEDSPRYPASGGLLSTPANRIAPDSRSRIR